MKKVLIILSVMFMFGLSGCDLFAEEVVPKTMQNVNIEDAVEFKMEIIWTYSGPFIADEYKEVYYYDYDEGFTYLEYTNYFMDGDSYFYYIETTNGITYLYDYDDVDFDYMEVPSRYRVDFMDYGSDFTFIDAFNIEFEDIEPDEDQGYDHWYKEIKISDTSEMMQEYLLSVAGPSYIDEEVGIEMWCHPTSFYCDYLFHLDNLANGTISETIDDLELEIAITHTFYTEDNKSKEDVLPSVYKEDDYPNNLDSLSLSGNRIFGQHYTGSIDFEYDGDCFFFEVDENDRYVIDINIDISEEDSLYFLILDDTYTPVFEGAFDSSSFINSMTLEADVIYTLIVAANDGTRVDIDYDFFINVFE